MLFGLAVAARSFSHIAHGYISAAATSDIAFCPKIRNQVFAVIDEYLVLKLHEHCQLYSTMT